MAGQPEVINNVNATLTKPLKKTERVVGGVSAFQAPDVHVRTPGAPVSAAHADFVYNGGPVVTCPMIYVTFWGSHWSDAAHQAQAARLEQFLKTLLPALT